MKRKRNGKQRLAGLLAILLTTLALAACGADQPAAASGYYSRGHYVGFDSKNMQYTKADYDLALSFRTAAYQNQTVATFNRAVLNWEDEEAYHKTEEALQRLMYSLPKDDPNADFILSTLDHTWMECQTKHYNACQHQKNPTYSGEASWETYGDIFGDQVVTAGAYADFWFDYQWVDETSLTVGERDAMFRQIDQGMKDFLSGQDRKKLQKEEDMEKALETELKKLLKPLAGKLTMVGGCDVSYGWEGYSESEDAAVTKSIAGRDGSYSKAQLKSAFEGLKFEGYQTMSIAKFNREVNAAFEDDKTGEMLFYALEMALEDLPEDDPNAVFVRQTIWPSQEEYQAKAEEVYTGKQTDPEYQGRVYSVQAEDVFGDQVPVGSIEADYSFTYRILDADKLTVQERNNFLAAVTKGVQGFLDEKGKSGKLNEAAFKKGIESVGQGASNSKIQMTGCTVGYFSFDN